MFLIYHEYPEVPQIQKLLITFIGEKITLKRREAILISFPRLKKINIETKDNQDLTPAEIF